MANTFNPTQSLDDSDYGSEFSEGEAEIIDQLLKDESKADIVQDNPIVTEIEYHDSPSTLRLPRFIGHENRTRDIEGFASSAGDETVLSDDAGYPDCKHHNCPPTSEAD